MARFVLQGDVQHAVLMQPQQRDGQTVVKVDLCWLFSCVFAKTGSAMMRERFKIDCVLQAGDDVGFATARETRDQQEP